MLRMLKMVEIAIERQIQNFMKENQQRETN